MPEITSKKIVYIDSVFDLFHRGHLESLIKAKNALNDRIEIIKHMKMVDGIIFPCPLVVDMDFIKSNNIDIVVHGFSNDTDLIKQSLIRLN